ncbi:S1 RNA-binding domain-containing protein [Lysinibacillus xylanilyticus]|uniref:S1 RNA-binding domain-containing protein n=1 Tax=Lysinibacillus xylanilyticus TaxID=582475 RepID=UPI0038142911
MANQEKVTLTTVESWNSQEQFYELTAWHRNNEMVTGVVRSIVDKSYRAVSDDNSTKSSNAEVLIIALPNGTTGYCAADNFLTREFKNYKQFVGRKAHFYIDSILIEENMLILNGKKAQEQRINLLWEEILSYEKEGTLATHTFKGIVTGQHNTNGGIFVNVDGQDCFMPRIEWSWNEREALSISEGETIEVKILRIDSENKRIVVSRRQTLPDPYTFLEKLKVGDSIAGKVSRVDPQHGIFVTLESGLDVKASKVRALEEPVIGDMVNCRIVKEIVRTENGRIQGRVVIVKYPNGKRKVKDLGQFLFE